MFDRVAPFAVILALAVACGGDAPTTTADDAAAAAPAENADKPWVKPEFSAEAMQAAASTRESMRFVADGGEFIVTTLIDGKPVRWSLGLDKVAMRIADVPTLEYPIGYVKVDPLTLELDDGGKATWPKVAIDTVFRRLGAPVQVFFDVQSVTELEGRLIPPDGAAKGTMIGVLQVADRQHDVSMPIKMARDEGTIEVELPAFALTTADIGFDDDLAKLASKLGVRIGDQITIEGGVKLVSFDGEALPTFVRTPVTVNTVDSIREKLEAEVTSEDRVRHHMEAQGVDPRALERMTPQQRAYLLQMQNRDR